MVERGEKRYLISRHSIKPKGDDVESPMYKGISEAGVDLARKSARNILDDMERAPGGAVLFLGGVSDEVRTLSTARVYGEELRKLVSGKNNYSVITDRDIPGNHEMGYSETIRELKRIVDDNPDKKIIIDVPLQLKELSLKQKGWFNEKGEKTDFTKKLFGKGKNEDEILKYWISHKDIDGLKGPTPEDVAKAYQKGLGRLEEFAEKAIGERLYKTGIVGHSFEADVYLAYLAGDGKVNLDTYNRVSSGKGMIKETEMASVSVKPNLATISYRGKQISKRLEHIVAAIITMSFVFSILSFLTTTGSAIGAQKTDLYGLVFIIIAVVLGLLVFRKKKKRFISFY